MCRWQSEKINLWSRIHFIFIFSFVFLTLCSFTCAQRVRLGNEVLISRYLHLLQNKKIGVICNHTSLLPNRTHLVDTLLQLGVNVTALFSPEHGIRGDIPAGEIVEMQRDTKSGLKIFSLYGKTKKPTNKMLKDVDIILFDLQDVGARFYTYGSTMAYAMEAAAENGKKFIVLDRPNPINGIDIEGPILDTALKSFIGMFPIPIRHGLTLGELAKMIVGEQWLGKYSNVDLLVIPADGWKRKMWFDETGLYWIAPSPNIKTVSTATVYPGTCLFEGTNVSEGRGTEKPFEFIGAPWIDGELLAEELNKQNLLGVTFHPIQYVVKSDVISAPAPKFDGKECNGVYIEVVDRKIFRPVQTALLLIYVIQKNFPEKFQIERRKFELLLGSKKIGKNIEEFEQKEVESFKKRSRKYLIYSDS